MYNFTHTICISQHDNDDGYQWKQYHLKCFDPQVAKNDNGVLNGGSCKGTEYVNYQLPAGKYGIRRMYGIYSSERRFV